MNSDEDTKPIPVVRPRPPRTARHPQRQSPRPRVQRSQPRSNAPKSTRASELEYFARVLAKEQRVEAEKAKRKKEREEQKKQIQGCIGTIVILAIVIAVVVNNWQNNERQANQNSLLREVEQATMTPCARTMQEIDRATLIYGRMEESNTASTRLDGLCDVNFHYWTDKPTEYERYDERNQLLRRIGTVIKEESLPVGRLNLRTYAPNRSGSYLLWKHEIFHKSELPYN